MEKIHLPEEYIRILSSTLNRTLLVIEKRLKVEITARGDTLMISGPEERVKFARDYFRKMADLNQLRALREEDFIIALDILEKDSDADLEALFDRRREIRFRGTKKPVRPKSLAQKVYMEAIQKYDIVFAVGPAGTGKTYLAMAMAIYLLFERKYGRIILTRPAIEAGEKLGFLPGTMEEKVNPYLRPLYDALYDLLDTDKAIRLLERGTIEIAPLAFMRGRTLNDSVIILDEAQNTTPEQMKMFLTRIGFDSKAIVTGDITQIDLPKNVKSGLVEAIELLGNIEGIKVVEFTKQDVVRHPLVQKIIEAYEEKERREKEKNGET